EDTVMQKHAEHRQDLQLPEPPKPPLHPPKPPLDPTFPPIQPPKPPPGDPPEPPTNRSGLSYPGRRFS
ncbi:MAG: hypothetical protein V3U86_12965, partial [Acidobacteriota bacterium]